MKFLLKFVAATSLCISVSFAAPEKGTMEDSRDGKMYKTVKIGEQVWMAENLNYETASSFCYENNPQNCDKYGRLYEWDDALNACPMGWHLPTKEEIKTLFDALGGQTSAGKKLKSVNGWPSSGFGFPSGGNGTDALGFSALPAGFYKVSLLGDGGRFVSLNEIAFFWSASGEADGGFAHCIMLSLFDGIANMDFQPKNYAMSVRCIQ